MATSRQTFIRAAWSGAGRLLLVELVLASGWVGFFSSHRSLGAHSGPIMGPFLIADALSDFHQAKRRWAASPREVRPFVHRFPSHPAYVFSFVRLNFDEPGSEYIVSFNDVLQRYRISRDGHVEAIGPSASAQTLDSKEEGKRSS